MLLFTTIGEGPFEAGTYFPAVEGCSAAIKLVDAGLPEDIVMKIGGWKTHMMFSRYNVVNSDSIRKAME